jgi:DNA-binding CsgD family transcriptional regulator
MTYLYPVVVPPPGALMMELRYCQTCGRPFFRQFAATEIYEEHVVSFTVLAGRAPLEFRATLRKDHGERFCRGCKGRRLLPDIAAQIAYLEQMPGTDRQMQHATRLPKYDETLLDPSPRKVARLRQHGPQFHKPRPLLSATELRVAERLATTKTPLAALAAELGMSRSYVKFVTCQVYKALDVRGREQLIALWACELFRVGVRELTAVRGACE